MSLQELYDSRPSHVVGIGASAGGLEALQILFDNMPDDLGVAYVVIQHLSPDFKSMMDELLSKNTKMPTHIALEGEELQANNVYLIPAGKVMRLAEGRIYLSDLPPDNRINVPINEFFRTLAEDQQNKAVGVILSGTGSDGSRGVLALKEVGALVIAQDPQEAQFDGMPISAINTGSVDIVLPVSAMGDQISKFVNHPLNSQKSNNLKLHISENTGFVDKVLRLIQKHTDLDFRVYKESTVTRRIEHRISINNKTSIEEYWSYVSANPEEVELLKQDLLIGVTQFFRDPEVWDAVKNDVVSKVVTSVNEEEPIRIWCAGCSTGEEAYTIAILFSEMLEKKNISRGVKVFASDIDQAAVAFAGNGIYPASISTEVPSEYLNKYFFQLADGSFQVVKELRQTVVFAAHNLIQDPPFSNMDFISCRNTLIYLQSPAQQKALAFFHFALKLNGYLLLGSAESTGAFGLYFDVIGNRTRIYQKTKDLRIPVSTITNSDQMRTKTYSPKSLPQFIQRMGKQKLPFEKRISLVTDAIVIDNYVPPTLIFNDRLQLIYAYGDTTKFTVKIKAGHVTNDLTNILEPNIVSHALSAAHQVIREKNSVLYENINVAENEEDSREEDFWSVKAFYIEDPETQDSYIGITFLNDNLKDIRESNKTYSIDQRDKQRISELDNSLIECQKLYKEALESLDSTSEELQSSNEELMAANEELQSTNEELQSVNEELYTVNSEYQQKISELTSANSDLETLLRATSLAVVFLDNSLKIRRYTSAVKEFINIIDFDIDRDFRDLSFRFDFEDLREKIEKANTESRDTEVDYEFEDYTVHVEISCYTSHMNNGGGLVVTFHKRDNV